MKKMKMKNGRELDFEDLNERFEAERIANERVKEAKLVIKHKEKIIVNDKQRSR